MTRIGGGSAFHRADLHGGSVGAQEPAIRQIKGVGFVARRMIGRGVERVEAMPLVLDVGSLRERETHSAEKPDRAVEHLRERVERARFVRRARQRKIERSERAGLLRGPHFFAQPRRAQR